MQPVPLGVPGELCISGAGLARGYFQRDSLTSERFIPNPVKPLDTGSEDLRFDAPYNHIYRTGDLARWRVPVGGDSDNGMIEFLGRIDKQVKIRGYRIEPDEINERLRREPGITDSAVIIRQDNSGENHLCAYIVPVQSTEGAESETVDGFKAGLARYLPEYMIPSYFVLLAALPLTPNGKLDRSSLPDPELHHDSSSYTPPRTEMEKAFADIWAEVLGVEQELVGLDFRFLPARWKFLKSHPPDCPASPRPRGGNPPG